MPRPNASESLANFDVAAFLDQDWQRRPVLIAQGLPDFHCPVDGNDLAALACDEEFDSRLILQRGEHWQLESGPFPEERFASLPTSHWTLLVQAVDSAIAEVAALNRYFRFLPRWRQQDIMISYATDGGNVGPHFDQYDVFLIQGNGTRRWRLGPACDHTTPLQANPELLLLAQFDCQQEFLLGPGDILYVPPGWAHWGVAEGDDCITLSVGFRAPADAEMLQDIGHFLADQDGPRHRYQDPPLDPNQPSGLIDDAALSAARDCLNRVLADQASLSHWFGQLMTHRPSPSFPGELTWPGFDRALTEGEISLALGARLAYRGNTLFADGEAFPVSNDWAPAVARFCLLEPGDIVLTHSLPGELLYRLYQQGTLAEGA